MSFSIPQRVFDKYEEVCDYFLTSNEFSRLCTLYYPAIKVPCDSHPFTSGGNIYQHGGPAPGGDTNCVYCGGQGYKEQEVTDTIRLRIYWNKKKWIAVGGMVAADAEVQVIGFLSDFNKFIQANSIELVHQQKQIGGSYKLLGEPFYHGFGKDRYFVAFLKKS